MTYAEMVKHVANSSPSKELCVTVYEFMRPTLQELKCRKIGTRQCDEKVLAFFNGEFKRYYALCHQHPASYWENLKRLGSPNEFAEFDAMKQAKKHVKETWLRLFPKKTKKVAKSEETVETAE